MKKQLLKESEVRKLMKFANIGALTDGFVERLVEQDEMEPEEDESPEMPAEEPVDDEGDEGEELAMEPEPDLEAEPETATGSAEAVAPAVKEFVGAMDEFLSAVAGTPPGTVSAEEGDEDAAAPDMGDMDAEPPADMGDMGDMGDMDAEAPDVGDPEGMGGPEEDDLEEDMINEVARRVARRLNRLRRR